MPEAAIYPRYRSHADRLLSRFGGSAMLVVVEQSGPSHDPDITEIRHPVTFLDTGSLTEERPDLSEATKLVGLLAVPEDIEPGTANRIEVRGHSYSVKSLEPIDPSSVGQTVFFELVANR